MSEKKEKTGRGLGCALTVATLAVLGALLTEERLVSTLAWLILVAPVAWAARWALRRKGIWGPRTEAAYGAAVVLAVAAGACLHPVTVPDGEGGERPATPRDAGEAVADALGGGGAAREGAWERKAERATPPGVTYTPGSENEATVEEALAELDGLIGLGSVKEEVRKFAAFAQVMQQRKAAGLKGAQVSYHMVFMGNPGTGKTTVARIMAKICKALGIVEEGQLVETDRGGLIAEYVGQTAVKTGKVIDCALGGVLFIDEAYALTENERGGNGYGAEAVATLLKRMEDDRDRLVVIVAGYTEEMERFLESNPGLASRFSRRIEFADYTAAELAAIFRQQAAKNQYRLSAEADAGLEGWIGEATAERDRHFGNGRWARNCFEAAIERQAVRLAARGGEATAEELMTLEAEDIGMGE